MIKRTTKPKPIAITPSHFRQRMLTGSGTSWWIAYAQGPLRRRQFVEESYARAKITPDGRAYQPQTPAG